MKVAFRDIHVIIGTIKSSNCFDTWKIESVTKITESSNATYVIDPFLRLSLPIWVRIHS